MPSVVWKDIDGRWYAYLVAVTYDRDTKRPHTSSKYLGADAESAEAKLRQLVPDNGEFLRLSAQLYLRRPQGRPPGSREEKAARSFRLIGKRYPDCASVQAAVRAALAVLERGGST